MKGNVRKCKEMRISFAKTTAEFNPTILNKKAIEVVTSVKLLELNISDDLKWNCHIRDITKGIHKTLFP